MALPSSLRQQLALPLIGAPMFIVSQPDLVLAQCKAGVLGAFPALNARPAALLDEWLTRIKTELADFQARNPDARVAPFAVNQIVHPSNDRLEADMALCVKHEVPVIITSLSPPRHVVAAAHSYGGLVFHDVINVRHAKKALDAGVDGLILVAHGAGGHAGRLSPFALVEAVRAFYDGPVILSGAISTGAQILAAQAMGADLAYMGTRFIATDEAAAAPAYKQMLVDASAEDLVYTALFSGVHGNYLRASVEAAGFDPDRLPEGDKAQMDLGSAAKDAKAWRDIWSAGQSTGGIHEILATKDLIARLAAEYDAAKARLAAL
ncbi:MAG: nitronate monooxygenase family protein [Sphingomonadales bacterium]